MSAAVAAGRFLSLSRLPFSVNSFVWVIRCPTKRESSCPLKGSPVVERLTKVAYAFLAKFVTVWEAPETTEKQSLSLIVVVGTCPYMLPWRGERPSEIELL